MYLIYLLQVFKRKLLFIATSPRTWSKQSHNSNPHLGSTEWSICLEWEAVNQWWLFLWLLWPEACECCELWCSVWPVAQAVTNWRQEDGGGGCDVMWWFSWWLPCVTLSSLGRPQPRSTKGARPILELQPQCNTPGQDQPGCKLCKPCNYVYCP